MPGEALKYTPEEESGGPKKKEGEDTEDLREDLEETIEQIEVIGDEADKESDKEAKDLNLMRGIEYFKQLFLTELQRLEAHKFRFHGPEAVPFEPSQIKRFGKFLGNLTEDQMRSHIEAFGEILDILDDFKKIAAKKQKELKDRKLESQREQERLREEVKESIPKFKEHAQTIFRKIWDGVSVNKLDIDKTIDLEELSEDGGSAEEIEITGLEIDGEIFKLDFNYDPDTNTGSFTLEKEEEYGDDEEEYYYMDITLGHKFSDDKTYRPHADYNNYGVFRSDEENADLHFSNKEPERYFTDKNPSLLVKKIEELRKKLEEGEITLLVDKRKVTFEKNQKFSI